MKGKAKPSRLERVEDLFVFLQLVMRVGPFSREDNGFCLLARGAVLQRMGQSLFDPDLGGRRNPGQLTQCVLRVLLEALVVMVVLVVHRSLLSSSR